MTVTLWKSSSPLRRLAGPLDAKRGPLGGFTLLVLLRRTLHAPCPTQIDVPRFIRQILHHDDIGAARTILDANIFGGDCGRVCPTEVLCEGACVDNLLWQSPVRIGLLQRFATDAAEKTNVRFRVPGPATGKKVAIIGAGPGGLSCAFEFGVRPRGRRFRGERSARRPEHLRHRRLQVNYPFASVKWTASGKWALIFGSISRWTSR